MAEDSQLTGTENRETPPEEAIETRAAEILAATEDVEAVDPIENAEVSAPVEVTTGETVAPEQIPTTETDEVRDPIEPIAAAAPETETVSEKVEPEETPIVKTEQVTDPIIVPSVTAEDSDPKNEPTVETPKTEKVEPVTVPVVKTETVSQKSPSATVPPVQIPKEPNPVMKRVIAFRQSLNAAVGKVTPPLTAYLKQWPRTFLVWFLFLLCLSVLVWRFLPGDATVGNYTPAQGLFIPITIFGGPLILAVFIATHGGLEWYSNTVAVKGIGLRLIDIFFKLTSLIGNLLPFRRNRSEEIISPHSGIADLPFPGLGFQGFIDRYIPPETATAEQVLEKVSRYQLQNLGKIAINFFIVYVLVKLPAIILWEFLSLSLEWSVYKVGFSLARVPFPALTIYHWELFLIENIAVALVIFFQEVRLDTAKTNHIDEVLLGIPVEGTEG
jgi:hypothetical protein